MLSRSLLHCFARYRVSQCRQQLTRKASTWAQNATLPSNKVQMYISKTHDPYLNLSIEHYLLRHTPQDSAILFLYINRPCIVIGRNQNPWLETNLNILETESSGLGKVDLVRRRSGGGAVFHDLGNVNWTVISPSDGFTRDKHAEMVVRALRRRGVGRARVNKRHDIVLDQREARGTLTNEDNLHITPWTVDDPEAPQTVKVSGSAYKLTRGRALHHGTCLLSSQNLQIIPQYLHSPAKSFIKAKGVESVSSPVSNIGLGTQEFQDAVVQEFSKMYPGKRGAAIDETIGDEALDEVVVKEGWDELQTPEWMFNQTPQFTFATHPADNNELPRLESSNSAPLSLKVYLEFRHSRVIDASLTLPQGGQPVSGDAGKFLEAMHGRSLWENWSWEEILKHRIPNLDTKMIEHCSKWLQNMLPTNLYRHFPRKE